MYTSDKYLQNRTQKSNKLLTIKFVNQSILLVVLVMIIFKFNYLYQYLSTYTGLLGIIVSGMHYAWPSPSLPKLLKSGENIQITSDEGSWLAIMPLIGSLFGCIIANFLIDFIGRKKSILLTSLPYFTAWIMIAYTKSIIILLIARFICGIADGIIFTAIPLYIGEISKPQIRGLLGSSISATWIFGMLLINLIGLYYSIKIAAIISSIMPILFFLTFIWMPESPYFLLMKQKFQLARQSLETLNRNVNIEPELHRLESVIRLIKNKNGNFLDLWRDKTSRKGFLIITLLRTAQQLSGVSAITFYTKMIFEEAGNFISSELATIIYVILQLAMAFICSTIVDKIGRRPLLIISLIGSSTSLFFEGTYFFLKTETSIDVTNLNFLPVIALLGFVIIFNIGMQPIPILMLGEVFPTNIKTLASGLSEVYFCILASIISKFFQIIKDHFGMYLPFYIFSFSSFINLIFIYLFVPETKGKTLEDIQESLKTKKVKVRI